MKKQILTIMLGLCCVSAFAALQYDITRSNGPEDPIKLTITQGGSLWVTSKVSSWYWSDNLSQYAKLASDNFGYTLDGKKMVNAIGTEGQITFFENGNPEQVTTASNGNEKVEVAGTITKQGYLVGNFEAGQVISLWMTNLNDKVGSELGSLRDAASRQTNLVDAAGKVVQNLGFSTGNGIEFIAVGGDRFGSEHGPSGQPLPGFLLTILFAGGAIGIASTIKRKFCKS